MALLRVGVAIVVLGAGCAKTNFADECGGPKRREPITVRGYLQLPYTTLRWKCGGPGSIPDPEYGCPIPLSVTEEPEKPFIHAHFFDGDEVGTLRPMPDGYNMIRDLRLHAEDGRTARLGQRVEVDGALTTYYGCNLIGVTSVRLLQAPVEREDVP